LSLLEKSDVKLSGLENNIKNIIDILCGDRLENILKNYVTLESDIKNKKDQNESNLTQQIEETKKIIQNVDEIDTNKPETSCDIVANINHVSSEAYYTYGSFIICVGIDQMKIPQSIIYSKITKEHVKDCILENIGDLCHKFESYKSDKFMTHE
jgi:hypothetical protein